MLPKGSVTDAERPVDPVLADFMASYQFNGFTVFGIGLECYPAGFCFFIKVGERLYVGRTGDSSSPHATAPYTRIGQHLGFSKAANSLRRLLTEAEVEPESCGQFDLISYGPIFPEIGLTKEQLRADQMALHVPVRDQMAGLEKKLRDALVTAGYPVMNVVHSNKKYDAAQWEAVRSAFSENFPELL